DDGNGRPHGAAHPHRAGGGRPDRRRDLHPQGRGGAAGAVPGAAGAGVPERAGVRRRRGARPIRPRPRLPRRVLHRNDPQLLRPAAAGTAAGGGRAAELRGGERFGREAAAHRELGAVPGPALRSEVAAAEAAGRGGAAPAQLRGAFEELSANPDVRYPAERVPRPTSAEIAPVRAALEALLQDSLRLLPDQEPEGGWDELQRKVRRLDFTRRFPGWRRTVDFFDALQLAVTASSKVTQYKWGDAKEAKAAAKALGERWEEFAAEGGAARELLDRWLAHRYRIALRFARAAAGHYAAERLRLARLNFQDLLLRAAALLREHPEARRELGERYRFVLVDEFQDTDPIQAEVLFLLASDDVDESRWTHVTPRPGALFVVGDPKQSIYRFRRADIAVYNQVKARFQEFGAVLTLTANFRSRKPIETF